MNIGITYDLKSDYLSEGFTHEDVAEFDNPDTITGIENALKSLGHQTDKIGRLTTLVSRLAAGDRWDLVFNIAEGAQGSARESQIPNLLEAYNIPTTFGNALCLALCLDKPLAKRVVRDHGIPTPKFTVVTDESSLSNDIASGLSFPLFAKPIAEGSGLGVSAAGIVRTGEELRTVCRRLLARHRQPVLVEEYLPGREFTVGILGTGESARVLGVMEVHLLDNAEQGVYSYSNKDQYEDRVRYRLAPDDAEAREAACISLAAYRVLGCRDAGRVDIRSDLNGRPQFMEINPLAGLNPDNSDLPILCRLLGIGYDRLIAEIVESAAQRVGSK